MWLQLRFVVAPRRQVVIAALLALRSKRGEGYVDCVGVLLPVASRGACCRLVSDGHRPAWA